MRMSDSENLGLVFIWSVNNKTNIDRSQLQGEMWMLRRELGDESAKVKAAALRLGVLKLITKTSTFHPHPLIVAYVSATRGS